MNPTKTYLVTGAAGFIGARFVESCFHKKIQVIAVDLPEHFRLRTEHRAVKFNSTVDRRVLEDWMDRNRPPLSAVVHLGACTDTTNLDEAYLKRVNLDYSKMLWNYATKHEIPFLYASSAATYGNGSWGYDDNESLIAQLKPLNPYGESKRLFDLWALEQEQKGKTPPAWSGFKFFNVFGFGERHKGKMASVALHAFDQIRDSGKVRLFKSHKEGIADGHQKRDFIFVDDVLEILHFAINKPISRGIYNCGSGTAHTFLELTQGVFKALNRSENIEFFDTPLELRERYQYFTEAKMERLRSEGFDRAFTPLEEGLRLYMQRLVTGR